MKNLENLLERFSNLLDKKTKVKESVSLVIKNNTGINIDHDSITISGTVLEVETTAAKKNEIVMKQERILEELKNTHSLHVNRMLFK